MAGIQTNISVMMVSGDLCAQNPCLNGGQCLSNGMGGFTCSCPNPYTGQRCEDRKFQN